MTDPAPPFGSLLNEAELPETLLGGRVERVGSALALEGGGLWFADGVDLSLTTRDELRSARPALGFVGAAAAVANMSRGNAAAARMAVAVPRGAVLRTALVNEGQDEEQVRVIYFRRPEDAGESVLRISGFFRDEACRTPSRLDRDAAVRES